MLPTPTIATVDSAPLVVEGSGIVDLLRQQSKVLIGADPVDGLPVLGDEPVLDPKEIESREVRWPTALRDRAVPDASRGDAVALGDHVRLCGATVRHRPAADRQG